jgi:hypothetical protein
MHDGCIESISNLSQKYLSFPQLSVQIGDILSTSAGHTENTADSGLHKVGASMFLYEIKENTMENRPNTSRKSSTAGNIVFLLLAFPFGLLYFLVVVIGFALGIGMLILWIGLPILFVTVVLIRGMAVIERHLVSSLLRVPLAPRTRRPNDAPRTFWRRFGSMIRDPYTWTSAIYMLLGIISFTLALALPILSAAVTLLPLAYLINLFINLILLKSGVSVGDSGIIIPYFIEVHGTFDLVMFARSFIGVPVGLALWFATRFLLNGLARLSAELAVAMLGSGEVEMSAQPEQIMAAPAPRQRQYPSYEEQYAAQEIRNS